MVTNTRDDGVGFFGDGKGDAVLVEPDFGSKLGNTKKNKKNKVVLMYSTIIICK